MGKFFVRILWAFYLLACLLVWCIMIGGGLSLL
jgi:hypothetical protein